jgi:uncharacterized protein YjbI with pentapeptide repeats
VDLRNANLRTALLFGADLSGASLSSANLIHAILTGADLKGTDLIGANLNHADLREVSFRGTRLINADLSSADLRMANFFRTDLKGANLDRAIMWMTVLADIDLSEVKGLKTVKHFGPSEISISTIYHSEGNIPEVFLRGGGVPDELITQIPALVGAVQPIQFYSCFISYSSKDEEFARRLHSRMREAGLRVWFAPEDVKGGEKLYEQIDRAIQVHDRLLLVLSEESLQSEWVMTEIRRARKAEVKEKRRKLFPIRLTDYDVLKEWECFDADQGKDLAVEVREYFIPDFSHWKSHDDFEKAFARLLSDLKASTS